MPNSPAQNPTTRQGPASRASCLNCGDARSGRYCAQCGQNDRNYMRALLPMLWELIREAFEVDSRVPRTVGLLFFVPGSLSREFSLNRRARYSSPVRLYLFASFLFFLVLSLAVPDTMPDAVDDLSKRGGPVEANAAQVDPSQAVSDTQLAALEAALRPGQGQKVDDILRRPTADWTRTGVAMLARLMNSEDPFGLDDASVPAAQPDPDRPGLLARAFATSWVDLMHDPGVFAQRFIGNMPIAMFFLLPFLALALAICYFRKRRYFVEHLVFAMHVQTFVFLVLSMSLLIPFGPIGGWVNLFLILTLEVYYLVALRRFYRNGWIWTLIKGFTVQWLYLWVLLPSFLSRCS